LIENVTKAKLAKTAEDKLLAAPCMDCIHKDKVKDLSVEESKNHVECSLKLKVCKARKAEEIRNTITQCTPCAKVDTKDTSKAKPSDSK